MAQQDTSATSWAVGTIGDGRRVLILSMETPRERSSSAWLLLAVARVLGRSISPDLESEFEKRP